jgi:hypothetical protein
MFYVLCHEKRRLSTWGMISAALRVRIQSEQLKVPEHGRDFLLPYSSARFNPQTSRQGSSCLMTPLLGVT